MTAIAEQARSLFLAALDRESDQWPAFLDEACGGNAEVRARVEDLLRAHQAMGSIDVGRGEATVTYELLPAEQPGATIGPYKLLEKIGEGGFGLVFMAEQVQPVRRRVALKVLKAGMDTRQVVARFEAERQALALMDHPNIARVFDGGVTDSGRPYFVMELVKGVPITEFCNQNHFTPRQRLELFRSVCPAVQHAHQKGVIHRDLKPSNVLVSRHDTTPVVKVIDFGVAKALGQELTDKTLFTGIAQMIGTPLYMSPEQAGMSDLDVDTRSDVYSLGVLLYELLTGTTPFDKERFRTAGYDEIRRIIREEEPPRPSTRLSTIGQAAGTTTAKYRVDPGKLCRIVRGELDWIVMKCLEKDRNRRYETASALAADVERYLRGEPVLAVPPSTAYRLRKFVRRNRKAVLMASMLSLATLLGVGALSVSSLVAWRANRNLAASVERERREAYFQRIAVAHNALMSENLATAIRSLRECPEELRGWEWYYLMRLCHVEPLVIPNRTGAHCVDFSPDGRQLVTGGGDGSIRFWDSVTGKFIDEIPGAHKASVASVRFHPQGDYLASTGKDGQVHVWDLKTKKSVFSDRCQVQRRSGAADTVAFRPPHGRQIAFARDLNTTAVRDWKSGQKIHELPSHNGHTVPVAYDPTGHYLLTGGAVDQILWDAESGKHAHVWKGTSFTLSSLAFRQDGEWVATGSVDRTATIRPTTPETRQAALTLDHEGIVTSVAFIPNTRHPRVITTAQDKVVRIWDQTDGREVLVLRGHEDSCAAVAVSPDGHRIASASFDETVRIWDATPLSGNENEKQDLYTYHQHKDEIRQLAIRPPGAGEARIVSIHGGKSLLDRPVKVWNPATGETLLEYSDLESVAFGVAWHPGGQSIAASGSDGMMGLPVRVFDSTTGETRYEIKPPEPRSPFTALAFHPDGRYLVTGTISGRILVWDHANSGRLVQEFDKKHSEEIRGIVFSANGRYMATASGNGDVKLWDASRLTEQQEPIRTLKCHVPGISVNLAFSPDGKTLATGGRGNVILLFDVETGKEVRSPLEGHRGDIHALAFSNDGRWLASGAEDCTVRIWDCRNGYKCVKTRRGHFRIVTTLAFSTDGTRLYSGSRDHTIKVWDTSRLDEDANH